MTYSKLTPSTPFDVHLQWFAENDSPDGGQGDLPPDDVTITDPGQAFYEYMDEEGGELHKFSSPDELGEFLKGSYLRQSDYTKKSQANAKDRESIELMRKQFENDRTSFNTQKTEFDKKIEHYKEYDAFLVNNPQVIKELRKMKGEFSDQDIQKKMDDYFQEKYGQEINDLKAYQQQQKLMRQRTDAETALKEKYTDYDSKAVQEAFQALQQGDLTTLLEVLHHSLLGRKSIPELEQKLILDQAKKKQAGLITSTGKGTTPPPAPPSTIEDGRQKAFKEYK